MSGFLKKCSRLVMQPLSPKQFALAVAVGAVAGIFPVLGITTVVSAAVALILRLNMVVVQVVNYAVYPLQLVLIIPFLKLGSQLSPGGLFSMSLDELITLWNHDAWAAVEQLWLAHLLAIVAWALLSAPLALLLYFCILPFSKRLPVKAESQ